jgi:hypothetical protein
MVVSRRVVAVLFLSVLPLVGARAQTEYEEIREPALRLLAAQLQADRVAAARDSVRAYLARYPGDALMQYNLACLVARSGETDRALERLETALAAGYRSFGRMQQDPDLASLHQDSRFEQLLESVARELTDRMQQRQLWLEEGIWSEPRPLAPDPVVPGKSAPEGSLRVRFGPESLDLEVTPPPANPDEVLVTVTQPQSLEEFATDRWTEYRAPLRGGAAVTRFARDGERLSDAAAGSVTDTGADWLIRLPWASLQPNRPPLELLLGINVTLRRTVTEPQQPAARWAAIRDPFAGSTQTSDRSFLPVSFDPGADPAPLLTGRLDRYFAVGDTLSVELALQGLGNDPGELAITVTAGDADWDTVRAVAADPVLDYVTVPMVLGDLPHGWFTITAAIDGPEGRLQWRDRGFRLPPDWFLERHPVLEEIPAAKRAIVQYHLFRVLRGQQQREPDADPTPLAGAVARTDAFLERWRDAGRILPEPPALMPGAFPLGEQSLQPAQMVMPAGVSRTGHPVVLVATDAPGLTDALANALLATAPTGAPILAVFSAPVGSGNPQAGPATILAAADWVSELLAPSRVALVGVGDAARAALRAMTLRPEAAGAVVLLASADLDPWPLSPPAAAARMAAMSLADLPLTVRVPREASPRTEQLVRALDERLAGARTEQIEIPDRDASALAAEILQWLQPWSTRNGR